ncbi:MAG: hypothetical protein ACR2O6_14915 [Ilumatobacteraceae bacterium]
MPRAQMMKSVEELVAPESVSEAIAVQERSSVFWVAVVGGAVLGAVLAAVLGLGGALMGAVVGVGAALGLVATVTYWIVAATDDAVLLCRSQRWRMSATEVVERHPPGTPFTKVGGIVNDEMEFAGRTVIVSRAHKDRLPRITTIVDEFS